MPNYKVTITCDRVREFEITAKNSRDAERIAIKNAREMPLLVQCEVI